MVVGTQQLNYVLGKMKEQNQNYSMHRNGNVFQENSRVGSNNSTFVVKAVPFLLDMLLRQA